MCVCVLLDSLTSKSLAIITFQVDFLLQCVLYLLRRLQDAYSNLSLNFSSSSSSSSSLWCSNKSHFDSHHWKFLSSNFYIMLLIRLIDFLRLQFLPQAFRVVGGKNLHATFLFSTTNITWVLLKFTKR